MPKWISAVVFASLSVALVSARSVGEERKGADSVLGHTMKSLEGKDVDLSKYEGKVVLFVNVASACGATPQYKDLQALHEKYGKDGLAVVGVPCNQFGEQEPGSAKEIRDFCDKEYKVSFDLLAKVDVNGDKACPLYKYLTSEAAYPKDAGRVKWNFEKFLVSREGKVVARYRTGVNPSSKDVVQAIESELAKK